jgi:hypothetical protein
MGMQTHSELVADPVGHISISGVHGRDELNERLAHARHHREPASPLTPLLLGATVGAVLMFLLKR